jgi:hypothetical protein
MAESPKDYSLQETVDGQTVTYDAAGNVISKNYAPTRGGPVETLLFRRKGENPMHVRHVNTHAHPHVKILVANGGACNYFINTSVAPQTWDRTGACGAMSGVVTDLEIREDVGGDPWLTVQRVIDQSAEIVLQASGSSCTYRFNKLTQRWERFC